MDDARLTANLRPTFLPVRHSAVTHALITVAPEKRDGRDVRLRVGLTDGSVVDGVLLSVSPDHISLGLPMARAQHIPAGEIRSLHVARRRPFRAFLLVALGIAGATAAAVGMAQVPFLRAHLPSAVGALVLCGAALAAKLVRRTGLGDWLTSWETLADVGEE